MIAVLIGCGLRRAEAAALKLEDFQLRDGRWVIADLNGKAVTSARYRCRTG
jgi:integrase